jgi:Rtf2 RING-finger
MCCVRKSFIQSRSNCCRHSDSDDPSSVRPGHDAPFQCPLTGEPLNGRSRGFLHRPTGLLLSEKGLQNVPKLARETILDSAATVLAAATKKGEQGEKSGVAAGGNAAALEATVAAGGAWQERDMLVVNPEGQDAEEAKDRVMFIAQKVWFLHRR